MNENNNFIKYLLVFLLVGVSTMPILKQQPGNYLLLGSVVLTLRTIRIGKEAFLFLLLAFALELYHNFAFNEYDFSITRQTLMFFGCAIFIIYYVRLDLLPIYVNILYYFSLISFVFFAFYYADSGLITNLVKSVPSTFVKTIVNYGAESKQINPIFYNFDSNYLEFGRNNGPFWEPTVFASMLIMAQIFNLLINKTLFNKKGIVFTIAIFTTFSTTGFLAYFLLLVCYFLLSTRIRTFTKLIVLGGITVASIGLFTNLSFLSEKISNEVEKADNEMNEYGGDSRLASAILDLQEISEKNTYVLFGKGMDPNARVEGPDKEVLRNCGDTALLVEWGAIFSIIYIGLLFYSFLELTRFFQIHWLFSIVFTLILLVLSFSEVFCNLPFFYSLLFLGFIVKRQYFGKEKSVTYDPVFHLNSSI